MCSFEHESTSYSTEWHLFDLDRGKKVYVSHTVYVFFYIQTKTKKLSRKCIKKKEKVQNTSYVWCNGCQLSDLIYSKIKFPF